MVGVPVTFTFDEAWEGLSRFAVFRCGTVVRDRALLLDNSTTVPHEVLHKPEEHLLVGVEGRAADGTLVIPTTWADAGVVLDGANASGDYGKDPSPNAYDDIMAAIKSGALRGPQGEKGDKGETPLRDINLGRLSRAEKAVLAGLKEGTPGKQVANLAVWAYAQANIDVSAYFTGDTISNIYRSLGNSNYYSVMLVPDSKNQQLDEDQLQIGDIFCGQYKGDVSTNGYWSAVYQGNNLWIKNEGGNGNAEVIAFDEGSTIYDAKEWNYYYILRPENIAVAEIDALKDLSKAEENYTGLLPIERGGTGAMTEAAARENLGITLANIGAMPGYLVNYDIRVTADSKTLDEQIDDILWEIFDKNRNNAAAVNAFVSVVCESGVGVDKFSLKAGGNRWMMLITKITSNYARVLAWCTGQFWMRTKHKVDPNDENWVWEDWEQEAPPMRYGVEYRTTEKWNGKPVYTKLVHCGYAPTDYKTVNHGIAGSFKAIRSFGSMGSYVLPAGMDITSGTKCNYHCVLTSRISITMANAGYTNLPVLVQIW